MTATQTTSKLLRLACLVALLGALAHSAAAGQGCPFDDGSCQTYCNQQGCNFGYCGHFAWIQCICRKCGDEWNWYDKVHYKPDKQVNQTELDSLKLNGSAPIIVTSNGQHERQPAGAKLDATKQQQAPTGNANKAATLTTLLIPDLSDATKLDLNDIPDENSEKFLDYLARNHEKLVQATGKQQQQQQPNDDSDDEADEATAATSAPGHEQDEQAGEETVEIQISSSNNRPRQQSTRDVDGEPIDDDDQAEQDEEREDDAKQASSSGSMTRLLRMAVHERLADDLV